MASNLKDASLKSGTLRSLRGLRKSIFLERPRIFRDPSVDHAPNWRLRRHRKLMQSLPEERPRSRLNAPEIAGGAPRRPRDSAPPASNPSRSKTSYGWVCRSISREHSDQDGARPTPGYWSAGSLCTWRFHGYTSHTDTCGGGLPAAPPFLFGGSLRPSPSHRLGLGAPPACRREISSRRSSICILFPNCRRISWAKPKCLTWAQFRSFIGHWDGHLWHDLTTCSFSVQLQCSPNYLVHTTCNTIFFPYFFGEYLLWWALSRFIAFCPWISFKLLKTIRFSIKAFLHDFRENLV